MKKSLFIPIVVAIVSAASCSKPATSPEATVSDSAASSGEWKPIVPSEVGVNAVEMFDDVMALATGDSISHNAMAISWGGFGRLYNRPVITVYVSSSRFTHDLLAENGYFTVSSFPAEEHEKAMYLGRTSGRDTQDKISDAGLTLSYTELGNPRIEQANRCFECKIIYQAPFVKDSLDSEVARFYDNGTGIHTMYVGEILNVWEK